MRRGATKRGAETRLLQIIMKLTGLYSIPRSSNTDHLYNVILQQDIRHHIAYTRAALISALESTLGLDLGSFFTATETFFLSGISPKLYTLNL